MSTPIGSTAGTAGPPALSLPNVGDWCDVAIVNEEKVAAYVFGTSEPALTMSGQPKTKDKVTVIVVNPGTAVVTVNKETRPPVADELAVIYFEGRNRWDPDLDKEKAKGDFKSWSGAKTDHGQLMTGDVFRWQFAEERPGKGAQPRRIRLVKLRAARPDEAERTARCDALFHEMKRGTPVGAPVSATPMTDF